MAIYNDVNCMFLYKDNNDELKAGEFKAMAVRQSGSISFAIIELERQFLVDEKVLIEAIKQNAQIETEGVWISLKKERILPIKCMICIDSRSGSTIFNVVGIRQFVAIKNEVLKEILDI